MVDDRDVRISVNGFDLFGEHDGVEWHVTFQNTDGLFDGVDSSLKTSDKIFTNGYFSNIPTYKGRSIGIEGHILGTCPESCVTGWEAFKTAFRLGEQTLTVRLGSFERFTTVLQSSSAPLVEWAGVNMLKFNISLTALSPYFYDVNGLSGSTLLPYTSGGMTFPHTFDDGWVFSETVLSGSVILTNSGTAASPVKLRIDGPVVNPQVTHSSGKTLTFNTTLGQGEYIEIDGETHEILFNGSDPARGRCIRREFASAEVGENVWRFGADEINNQAKLTVSFNPAYI